MTSANRYLFITKGEKKGKLNMEYIIDIDEEGVEYAYDRGDGTWTLDGRFALRRFGWIDINCKKPFVGQSIVACNKENPSIGVWCGWIGSYEIPKHVLDDKIFTHWMPLPEHIRITSGNEV